LQGKPDKAIIEFRNALQVAPQFAEAHNALGLAYWQKGWIFDARAAFERAIEIRPDFVERHLNSARLGLEPGATQIAEAAIDGALRIEPSNPRGIVYKGIMLVKLLLKATSKGNVRERTERFRFPPTLVGW
jgi:tetratricopeptide (TPR) repeat protein